MIHEDPRLERIRTLEASYSALKSDLPFLNERIDLLHAVIVTAQNDHDDEAAPLLCRLRRDLGYALYTRYHHIWDVRDLYEAQDCLRYALQDPLVGLDASFPSASSLLASVLRERARELEIDEDERLEEALKIHRQAFTGMHKNDISSLERAYHTRELGLTLRIYNRYVNADPSYLLESVDLLRDARLQFNRAECDDLLSMLGLCASLHTLCQAENPKQMHYVEEAFSLSKQAALSCSANARDYYYAQYTRAVVVNHTSWFRNDVASLNEVISGIKDALRDAPLGWAQMLTGIMGQTLHLRFRLCGREDDISESISLLTMRLKHMDQSHETWGELQHHLSQALCARFSLTGNPEDIDGAIRARNMAFLSKSTGLRHLIQLRSLAECRAEQYNAYGDIAHLDECIASSLQGVQTAPPESVYFRGVVGLLLEALQLRYEQLKKENDLDQALQLIRSYLLLIEGKDIDMPYRLVTAGNIFMLRFQLTSSMSDLDQATSLHKRAVDVIGDKLKHHKTFLSYANTLRVRFEALGEHISRSRSLQLQQKLYSTLPNVHPDRVYTLCSLARLHLCSPRDRDDIARALGYLFQAVKHDYCSAHKRVKNVREVLTYMTTHDTLRSYFENKDHISLLNVYSSIIDLLPQVASFWLDGHTRLQAMVGAGNLTTHGAVHAISLGRLEHALEILEAGRGIFWSQGLQLRTQFGCLPKTIGYRLTRITRALGQPMIDTLTGPQRDDELGRRRQLGDEFQATLNEARCLPGFENLLRNSDFDSLMVAAERHPVVVFVAGDTDSHAIIVFRSGDPRLVSLPNISNDSLQTLLQHLHIRLSYSSRSMGISVAPKRRVVDVYRELWTSVMLPVISCLGWQRGLGRQRPRLTLCPTGGFMQLPLHAAGIYTGKDRVSCLDYFVASYTPSISVLLNAQKSLNRIRCLDANMLLVAVEHPFQGPSLPMTTDEAERILNLVPSQIIQASICADVLEHLQSASIVHLACHGSQDSTNALQSGFFLDDGLLTVSKLMELELPNAFLAVLSACETAKGDAAQPDQAIHLAGTMLFAGFKSVVATMWYMDDLDGPVIAESLYSSLFNQDRGPEYLDPNDVPYALDEAVRKLRDSGLDPSFWATYIHIGV